MIIFPITALLSCVLVGQLSSAYYKSKLDECLKQQVEQYGDLCAEESTGYEKMSGSEAHREGVSCAIESVKICMEAN